MMVLDGTYSLCFTEICGFTVHTRLSVALSQGLRFWYLLWRSWGQEKKQKSHWVITYTVTAVLSFQTFLINSCFSVWLEQTLHLGHAKKKHLCNACIPGLLEIKTRSPQWQASVCDVWSLLLLTAWLWFESMFFCLYFSTVHMLLTPKSNHLWFLLMRSEANLSGVFWSFCLSPW